MSTTIEQIRDEVAQAYARLAAAESKLRELESKPAKWEPKGGGSFLSSDGRIGSGGSDKSFRLCGSEYPTLEAAESALPYVTFYKRLCCLAQELNPSGRVGGDWFVVCHNGKWCADSFRNERGPSCLFESSMAAGDACEIMNRDGWQLPTA